MKKCALVIIMLLAFAGCKEQPLPHPRFQNFDIVTKTLSGEKAQVVNNRVEYDKSRGCWIVQIKMEKESTVGRMARKLLGKHEVKAGFGTLTLYEAELTPWKDF